MFQGAGQGSRLDSGNQSLTCSDSRRLCHSCRHWISSPTRPVATRSIMRSNSTWGKGRTNGLHCQPRSGLSVLPPYAIDTGFFPFLNTSALLSLSKYGLGFRSWPGPQGSKSDGLKQIDIHRCWTRHPFSLNATSLYLVETVKTQRLSTELQEQA